LDGTYIFWPQWQQATPEKRFTDRLPGPLQLILSIRQDSIALLPELFRNDGFKWAITAGSETRKPCAHA
jgi:hypothetical protein